MCIQHETNLLGELYILNELIKRNEMQYDINSELTLSIPWFILSSSFHLPPC